MTLSSRTVIGRSSAWWGPALFVGTVSGRALADPTTIVLVRSSNAVLDERLDAELSTLGFTVNEIGPADPAAGLEGIARSNGAIAALRVSPDDAVELWVAARSSAPAVDEKVPLDARRGWNVAAVLALEALRAHLLEVRQNPAAPPPPAPGPELPAPPPPASDERRPWLWLHVGAGVDLSPGGFPPSADVLLELRLEPRAWLSISPFGAFTPAANHIDGPGGEALTRRLMAGLGFDVQTTVSRVTLSVGIGGTFVFTAIDGDAAATGYAARDVSTRAIAPMFRGGASFGMTRTLRARVALAAGATLPQASVSFADRQVATWGRPFGLATLGFEWGAL